LISFGNGKANAGADLIGGETKELDVNEAAVESVYEALTKIWLPTSAALMV
jgi:hypothetical protein